MRYAQIRKMDISNGEGIGAAIFVQGCPIRCKGCFQPETWNSNGGEEFDTQAFKKLCSILSQDYISRFSILGGEPLALENLADVKDLILYVSDNFPNKKIWIWTGYTYENLISKNSLDIESIFGQTIEKDTYKVFIQKCGDGDLYIKKYKDYFEVIGTPNLEFDWEIKAIQKGYKNVRLEIKESDK